MKVIQYIDSLGSGGKERQVMELLKGLSGFEDIDIELILMSEEIHYSYLENLKIKPHFLLRRSKKDPLIYPQLFSLCKKIKPDIIHSWESMCSVYAMPVAKLLGIKFVNGFLRNAPPNFSVLNKTWLRAKFTFPFSDAIVANSKAGLKAYRVKPHNSYFVHNGFDMSRLTNLCNSNEVRNRLGVKTDNVVGMVASFSDNKDYNTFLSAAQTILSRRNDVSFVMVGDGYNLKACKNKVLPEFKSPIKFLGRIKNIEEIVNIFSLGVLSSNALTHGEGISNSIMEYMALGKPVIATDCGGNDELIIDGETGYLVSQANAEELAMRIVQLLDDDKLASRFGEAGHRRIVNEFSLEKMTTQYVKLYREILTC